MSIRSLTRCLENPPQLRHISKPNVHPRPAFRASFHTTPVHRDDSTANPYEVLGVNPSATPAEIKKQFFELSKVHHPDHNPNNQEEASRKFVAISDAYHIVGNAERRAKYDGERQRHMGVRAAAADQPRGSYAGGRTASGLSRRRTAFRGPPPSFYRNGGWGAAAGKRKENASADPRGEEARRQYEQQGTEGPFAGTAGPWPFTTDPNDVPHFNRDGHYRTTSTLEQQLKRGRHQRRHIEQMLEEDSPGNVTGQFFMILAILTFGIGTPVLIFGHTVFS